MKRTAWIRLLDCHDDLDADDHETTLVHELLHLVMPVDPRLKKSDLRYQEYERSIDQLARTLVALKRAA
jgi:hypothetical protein